MAIRVSGKNMDLGEVLRGQAEARLNAAVKKYVDSGYSGHVTVTKDGIGFKTECAVHFDHGPVMSVTGESTDPYQSVSIAIERVAKLLRRHKRRKDRHGTDKPANGADFTAFAADFRDVDDDHEDDVIETTGSGSVIIAEAVANAPLHSTTTAVAALEKGGAPVLVFRNSGTQRVNVLYRRADGHFGWVDIG
jgi:ribosomal subunit interface protein